MIVQRPVPLPCGLKKAIIVTFKKNSLESVIEKIVSSFVTQWFDELWKTFLVDQIISRGLPLGINRPVP